MRICIVHNRYGIYTGEERVVDAQAQLLARKGHQIRLFEKTSEGFIDSPAMWMAGFFSGIYSFKARREFSRLVDDFKPDIVHIHNLYPFISCSILSACRKAGIPVVMTLHNFRLICPNALYFSHGEICERCTGGREYWCILRDCESNILKSTGYALRSLFARLSGCYKNAVDYYILLTEFQKKKFQEARFDDNRMEVIPNFFDRISPEGDTSKGDYAGYAGRISPEKDIAIIIAAARRLPEIKFKMAGDYHRMKHLTAGLPANIELLGTLKGDAIENFYRKARIILFCSNCYETFPMALGEAMSYAKPVIASRLGGIPEILGDSAGLLYEPGDPEDFAQKILRIWHSEDLQREMGREGRKRAITLYSADAFYQRLSALYEKACASRQARGQR